MIRRIPLRATEITAANAEASFHGHRIGRAYLVMSACVRLILGRFYAIVVYFIPTGREKPGY